MDNNTLPGCAGEHLLQEKYATKVNAKKFYDREVYEYITQTMELFICKQRMLFIATSDKNGECDSSFRSGEDGFVEVLSPKSLIYPEFGGNGVMASLGNISENGHIGLLFVDFFDTKSGLHINGKASIIDSSQLEEFLEEKQCKRLNEISKKFTQKEVTWVLVDVEEAYIHCSKNIPSLSYN